MTRLRPKASVATSQGMQQSKGEQIYTQLAYYLQVR